MKPWLLVLLLSAPLLADTTVRIKSDAPSVEVLLDGASMGKTPLTLTVTPGNHELKFMKEGFEGLTRPLEVKDVSPAKLFVVMTATPKPLPALPLTLHALHQHRAGACSGVLTVAADKLSFKSEDDTDVFEVPLASIRSLTRGMGAGVNITWGITGEYSGVRLDTSDRNFGLFAFAMDEKLAAMTPKERTSTLTFQMMEKPTGELFRLLRRLWLPLLKPAAPPAPQKDTATQSVPSGAR